MLNRPRFVLCLFAGVALSVGLALPTFAQALPQRPIEQPPPNAVPGLIDIDGFNLFLTCVGTGSPPVILDAGADDNSRAWRKVQPAVATLTQTCAYDRANNGYSDSRPSPDQTTALQNATELHTLLAQAGISGPYVLVGHSYAAAVDQVYAGQYPEDVVGLVLVDPIAGFFFRGTSHIYGEVLDFDTSRQQVEASRLPNVPLIVLTGGSGPYSPAQFLDEHRAIAARSPQGQHVVVPNSGHQINEDQPDAVIDAIKGVLEAALNGGAATVSLCSVSS